MFIDVKKTELLPSLFDNGLKMLELVRSYQLDLGDYIYLLFNFKLAQNSEIQSYPQRLRLH